MKSEERGRKKRKEKRREGKKGIISSVRKDLERKDESCKAENIIKKKKVFEVGELADREGIEDWRIKRKVLTEIVK